MALSTGKTAGPKGEQVAIRIRSIDGEFVALCAARSIAKEGDVYLDDAAHAALNLKFRADFAEEEGRPIERPAAAIAEESNNTNRVWWDGIFDDAQTT